MKPAVAAAYRREMAEARAALDAGDTFYTHNYGIPPLREALAAYVSRLHRPVPADEIIVIDDGSSDQSYAIASSFGWLNIVLLVLTT